MALTISDRLPTPPMKYTDQQEWARYVEELEQLNGAAELSRAERITIRSELEFARLRVQRLAGLAASTRESSFGDDFRRGEPAA